MDHPPHPSGVNRRNKDRSGFFRSLPLTEKHIGLIAKLLEQEGTEFGLGYLRDYFDNPKATVPILLAMARHVGKDFERIERDLEKEYSPAFMADFFRHLWDTNP